MLGATDLADIEEIRRLKARYFRFLDGKNWDGWRDEVFTADVRMDVMDDPAQIVTGIDAAIALVKGAVQPATTVHHGFMPEIELTGPDTATGVWAMQDLVVWPADAPLGGKYTRLEGAGHYIETYARRPDGWRISSVRLTRLHVALT